MPVGLQDSCIRTCWTFAKNVQRNLGSHYVGTHDWLPPNIFFRCWNHVFMYTDQPPPSINCHYVCFESHTLGIFLVVLIASIMDLQFKAIPLWKIFSCTLCTLHQGTVSLIFRSGSHLWHGPDVLYEQMRKWTFNSYIIESSIFNLNSRSCDHLLKF